MLKPFRLASCGLVAVAVVASGCGSSKTASTSTATTGATATQNTGATQAPQTSKAHAQNPPATKPAGPTGSPKSVNAPKLKIKALPNAPPNGKYEYPVETLRSFIAICTAGNASKSSCECIIEKFESRKVQEGQSLAELLGLEVALHGHLRLNPRAQQYARECKSTI